MTEESLRQDIVQLQHELTEARIHHTPEMHHYKALQSKIAAMEARHTSREHELRVLLEKAESRGAVDAARVEQKWRQVLRDKDAELMRFREELDAILEVLRELKRQGIILPISSGITSTNASVGSPDNIDKQFLMF